MAQQAVVHIVNAIVDDSPGMANIQIKKTGAEAFLSAVILPALIWSVEIVVRSSCFRLPTYFSQGGSISTACDISDSALLAPSAADSGGG
jgi:hypothetical protein